MQFNREKFNGHYSFGSLSGLCPACNHIDPVGDIEVRVKIQYDAQAPIEQIRTHGAGALNMEPETIDTRRLVNVYCRCCGTRMLLVDTEVAELLRELNGSYLYTKYSCAGHIDGHSKTPYVTFYHPDTIWAFNYWLCLKYKAEMNPLSDESFYSLILNRIAIGCASSALDKIDTLWFPDVSEAEDTVYAGSGHSALEVRRNFITGLTNWDHLFDKLYMEFIADAKKYEKELRTKGDAIDNYHAIRRLVKGAQLAEQDSSESLLDIIKDYQQKESKDSEDLKDDAKDRE